MAEKITAVKGMNDIAPPQSAHWEWLEDHLRALMRRYGYRNLRTPIVEPTALFVRGLGEVTDIVEKEMYSFQDRLNGSRCARRTPPVWCARCWRAICCTTAASGCITWAPCFAMSGHSAGATDSSTSSAPKPWVLPDPMWMRS